ncbi:MAG TPA: DinB family protein [Thermoanaerobaculia bacterium]
MDALTVVRDLLRHMEWADAAMWASVRRLNSDDARLERLLEHLHATQHAFLTAWRERPFDEDDFKRRRDIPAVERWARQYYDDAGQFVASVDAGSLDRTVRLPWAERYIKTAVATTLGETMLQIASHTTHHRGQVNMRVRELGGEPPLVDYIAWLWQGRPPASWGSGL